MIALVVSVAISAPAVSFLRPRPATWGEAMDVDEVTAALAVVALEEKPAGSWEKEEDSVKAALADESVVDAAARSRKFESCGRASSFGAAYPDGSFRQGALEGDAFHQEEEARRVGGGDHGTTIHKVERHECRNAGESRHGR